MYEAGFCDIKTNKKIERKKEKITIGCFAAGIFRTNSAWFQLEIEISCLKTKCTFWVFVDLFEVVNAARGGIL